jgi:hypothetical protein
MDCIFTDMGDASVKPGQAALGLGSVL